MHGVRKPHVAAGFSLNESVNRNHNRKVLKENSVMFRGIYNSCEVKCMTINAQRTGGEKWKHYCEVYICEVK